MTRFSRTGRPGATTAPSPAGTTTRQPRLAAALRNALGHVDGGRVLFIGHGAILRATIPAICPGTPRPATDLRNCGIAELELRPTPDGVTGILNQWPVTLDEDAS
jgi:broad specificity phosphatase PhoE